MVSGVITLVGIGLRQAQAERESARAAEAAAERLALDERAQNQLKQDQEQAKRNEHIDVSIRAAELLGGGTVSPEQKAAALLALANLGEFRFALNLLQELWPKREVSSHSATWLIGEIFLSMDDLLSHDAASLLSNNAHLLTDSLGSLLLPRPFDGDWDTRSPLTVRSLMLTTITAALMTRPRGEWRRSTLNGVLYTLYKAAIDDPQPSISNSSMRLAVLLIECLHPDGSPPRLGFSDPDRGGIITYVEISQRLQAIREDLNASFDPGDQGSVFYVDSVFDELQRWAERS